MILLVGLAGCDDDPNSLLGTPGTNGVGAPGTNAAATAIECTVKPAGRAYVGFDGVALESTRINENVAVNRARIKPYTAMAGEFRRVLGVVPAGLPRAAGSFDDPPPRWFAEAQLSGVSLHALFDLAFDGCVVVTQTPAEYGQMPTAQSATTTCASWMSKAWNRTPTPTEINGCVSLATTKLDEEPDPRRRWAYACASILSSSQFLTF